jgi:hypothetical protein
MRKPFSLRGDLYLVDTAQLTPPASEEARSDALQLSELVDNMADTQIKVAILRKGKYEYQDTETVVLPLLKITVVLDPIFNGVEYKARSSKGFTLRRILWCVGNAHERVNAFELADFYNMTTAFITAVYEDLKHPGVIRVKLVR